MKKIIMGLTALAALTLNSCSNDDIEIKNYGTLQVQVGTSSLYEATGSTYAIQNQILGSTNIDYFVGVYALLYDTDGRLVAKDSAYVKTLDKAIFNMNKVGEGTYTLVAVQAMAGSDKELLRWVLKGEENLNTLRIENTVYVAFWYNAVGVATQQVNVTNSTVVDLSPAPIGYIVQFEAEGWAGSGFVNLGYYYKNAADGVYLDPGRDASNRLYYDDYNASNTWTAKGYFRDLENGLEDEEAATLFVIDTGNQQVAISWSNAASWNDGYKFTGMTDTRTINFVAGTRYAAGAILNMAEQTVYSYIGELAGYEEWKSSVQNLFDEPYLTWGASVATVKNWMSNKGYRLGGDQSQDDGSYVLWYRGKNKEVETDYYFDNSTTGLNTTVVFLNSEDFGEDVVMAYLEKLGYTFITQIDDDLYYQTADGGSYVQLGLNSSNYWYIIYFSATSSGRLNAVPAKMKQNKGDMARRTERPNEGEVCSLLRQAEQFVVRTNK